MQNDEIEKNGQLKKKTENTPNKPGKSTKLYELDHVNEIT